VSLEEQTKRLRVAALARLECAVIDDRLRHYRATYELDVRKDVFLPCFFD